VALRAVVAHRGHENSFCELQALALTAALIEEAPARQISFDVKRMRIWALHLGSRSSYPLLSFLSPLQINKVFRDIVS